MFKYEEAFSEGIAHLVEEFEGLEGRWKSRLNFARPRNSSRDACKHLHHCWWKDSSPKLLNWSSLIFVFSSKPCLIFIVVFCKPHLIFIHDIHIQQMSLNLNNFFKHNMTWIWITTTTKTHRQLLQTWYLSKILRNRSFGRENFTQKKRKSRYSPICDKRA